LDSGVFIVKGVAIALVIFGFGTVIHMALKKIFSYVEKLINWEYRETKLEKMFK